MSSQPNFGALLASWWGTDSYVDASFASLYGNASNLVVAGTNPPYFPSSLYALYPRFGGTAVQVVGTTTLASATVPITSSLSGIQVGQVITGPGIPDGTNVARVVQSPATITLNQAAFATTPGGTFTVYVAPPIPVAALNIYITLASATLNAARWLEMWPTAMALYLAHLSTLWMNSEGAATASVGAATSSGMARGIVTSKSVGDVSISFSALAGNDDYGDLQLTTYGQALARLCKVVGRGPIFVS